MDQILSSLLLSDQSEIVKKQVVQKIAGAGTRAEDATIVKSMFKTTTNFILDADQPFAADLCKKVYVKWAKCHKQALLEFFDAEFTTHLLDGKFKHPVNAIWLLHETFLLLRGTDHHKCLAKIVEAKSIGFVRNHPNDDVLTALCKLLFEFKESIPTGENTSTFCVAVVHAVSAFSAPTDARRIPQFIVNVTKAIGTFMRHIWHNSGAECVLHCLKAIFTLISYVDEAGSEPCIALAGLVSHVPPEMIEKVIKTTVSDASIADANMIAALQRVIDWLSWPVATNIEQWILGFLRELALAHKYTILIRVTEVKIGQVYVKLHYPVVRERAMAVLTHMLLSFQHSPEAFHKIVQQVPATVESIKNEGGPESGPFLDRFSELLHCLMTLHPGFPELYDKVLDTVKDYHKPSADVIRLRLTQSKWSFQHKSTDTDYIGTAARFAKKSETGKTGLTNLGNTCYMNSVIQALFMCDRFRKEIIRAPISPQQFLLVKLQLVFAHLAMTQRAAYSPLAFLRSSRPPWFSAGHQQDCSEFLRYLLDQLHEQELVVLRARKRTSDSYKEGTHTSPKRTKNSKSPDGEEPTGFGDRDESRDLQDGTLIRRTYGGQMCTTYKCLNCGKTSARTEEFTDIPLAFPDQEQQQATGKTALAGGAMSVSPTTGKPVDSAGSTASGTGNIGSREVLQLETMLQYYLKPELLQGDNRYQCDSCGGLQDAERSQHVAQAPEFLILTLLRFAYNAKTQSRSKICTDVTCPRTIQIPIGPASTQAATLSPSSAGQSTFYMPATSIENETYCLYAVVVHSGTSSECGHYYCYARHSETLDPAEGPAGEKNLQDDKWFLFNDSRVTFASYNSFSNVTKKFAKDTIYLLLYKRASSAPSAVDVAEPSLRKDLREAVEKDNKLFIQEQELEGRARAMQRASTSASSTSWFNQWKDDDDGGPPGSCGGGGGGGMDLSGFGFVF